MGHLVLCKTLIRVIPNAHTHTHSHTSQIPKCFYSNVFPVLLMEPT